MIDASGVMRMPKQEVGEGQKAGYVGEDTGQVETYDPPKPGDSNVKPSLDLAQARVKAAELALKVAQRDLDEAQKADKETPDKSGPKPVVGTTAPATSSTQPETPTPPNPPGTPNP